ncbi:unnamed protein product [Danaus chrysippus]|uniref:(African queen) hypothetical protein n=1 Tax=Danaus chrysippus TaxID=151541 RepID=A0A8J2MHZ5_9NEOP|nr:unnamed protein product [Danaus chrysippus]
MKEEYDCKCIKIVGHLEAVKWLLSPRLYKPSTGPLALGDWKENPHIWLYYVESADGLLLDDDVLRSTDTRYWSIHDVQRYFLGELHCDQVLFTYQYPSLKLPTHLGTYLWKANTALKISPKLFMKELHISIEETLKDNLQLVSFENLCCTRLEGVRLIQQLACFAAKTLKYLFLWRFVLPNENPLLINYSYISVLNVKFTSQTFLNICVVDLGDVNVAMTITIAALKMTTDEDKCKIAKLLQGIEVPEIKTPERSLGLVKEIQEKYGKEVEEEVLESETYENPYIPDKQLLEENERKLKALLAESKRAKKEMKSENIISTVADPKRPWRIHSNKEKLLRIDSELKQHKEKSTNAIKPMEENDMKDLIKKCQEEALTAPRVGQDKLRETVDEARRCLPNFQYKKIENSTATAILPEAHSNATTPQSVVEY